MDKCTLASLVWTSISQRTACSSLMCAAVETGLSNSSLHGKYNQGDQANIIQLLLHMKYAKRSRTEAAPPLASQQHTKNGIASAVIPLLKHTCPFEPSY